MSSPGFSRVRILYGSESGPGFAVCQRRIQKFSYVGQNFLVLKWKGVLISKYGTEIEHIKQKELFRRIRVSGFLCTSKVKLKPTGHIAITSRARTIYFNIYCISVPFTVA